MAQKTENPPQIHSSANITIKSKIRKVKTYKKPENINKSSVIDPRRSINTTELKEMMSVYEGDIDVYNTLDHNWDQKDHLEQDDHVIIEKPLKTDTEVFGYWKRLREDLKRAKKTTFLDNHHWWLYKMWRKTLKNGINAFGLKWKKMVFAAKKIQSLLRMALAKKKYIKQKKSGIYIQNYWRKVHSQRKKFLKIRFLAKSLSKYIK